MSLVASFLNNYNGLVKFYILNHAYSRGLAACQNTALDYVSGQFLIHLYPNESLAPYAVKTLVQHQIETNADIVSSNGIGFFHCGGADDIICEPTTTKSDTLIMMFYYPLYISCRLIRTALYFENNIRAVEGMDQEDVSSTLPKLVFCSNNVTAVKTPLWKRYLELVDEGEIWRFLQAIDVLIEYFADHDRYLNELYKKKIMYVKGMLSEALYVSDKEGYNRALGELKDIPRRYFHYTKLKDIWQNFLLHHYSIRKIVQDYQHRRKS